jgi:hypothetical protein
MVKGQKTLTRVGQRLLTNNLMISIGNFTGTY